MATAGCPPGCCHSRQGDSADFEMRIVMFRCQHPSNHRELAGREAQKGSDVTENIAMQSRTLRLTLQKTLIAVALLLLADGGILTRASAGEPDDSVVVIPGDSVVIPGDWRERYPFSARFAAERESLPSTRLIRLAAASFATDALVGTGSGGARSFEAPDMSSFAPELVREPFIGGATAGGATAGAGDRVATDLFVVQAADPKLQVVLRQTLEAMGIAIRGSIPDNAYLVRLTSDQVDVLAQSPAVVWLGFFQPAWKVAPKLDYLIESEPLHELRMTALFEPQIFPSSAALETALAPTGLRLDEAVPRDRGWKLRLSGAAVDARKLAAMSGCLWVERFADYRLDNNVGRTSTATATGRGGASGPLLDAEDVWARGIRGEGRIAAASDTGLSTGDLATLHRDFGHQGSPTNPMRLIAAYALGRATWDDDQTISGAGHGTHTSGSLVGNGVRSGADPANSDFPASSYAGTAPKAGFVFQSLMDSGGGLGGIPGDLNTLFQTPYDDGARVHSNSWSSPVDGAYTADAQEVDEFVWNNPDMVITFTAGNRGNDGKRRAGVSCLTTGDPIDGVVDDDAIGSPGTAKNNITVGASENYRPDFTFEVPEGDCNSSDGVEQKTWGWFSDCQFSVDPIFSDLMADNASGLGAFSSRGPTNDGRIKPDLVAPGVAVVSTRTDQNPTYEQWGSCSVPAELQTYYVTKGGTSMSTPLTAGAAVLVRQYYEDGWHGEGESTTNLFPVAGDGFNPSAALVKATLVNGAWDMVPGQYGTGPEQELPPGWDSSDLPNNAAGYGRVDLEAALFPGSGFGRDPGRDLEVHDASPGLATSAFTDYPVTLAASGDPLIVTLVWSDPYAELAAGSQLVNDLDLTVTSPGGTVYLSNGIDRTTGGADRVNNVEQVKVTAPETGVWTVRVNGWNVPGNAVPGTTTQPYALAISAVFAPPCAVPAAPAGLTATSVGSNRIDLDWNAVAADGYSVHRATAPGGPYERIATGVTGTSYSDTSVSGNVTYYYVVTAINDPNCESPASAEASATGFGDCGVSPVFGGVTSVGPADSGGSCILRLEWSAGSSVCPGSLVYNVYRGATPGFIPDPTPGSGNLLQACVTDTFFDDATAVSGSEYFYIVRAEDATAGNGGPCQSGNEDLGTLDVGGDVGGDLTSVVFADDFDGSQTPGDLWHFGHTFGPAPSCPATTTDWYRPETGFCSGNSAASNNGAAAPTYSNDNNGAVVLGVPPSGGPPFSDGGIVLPAGASSITLTFKHDYDFEQTSENWDGGRLRISVDNWPNFVDIAPVGGYPGSTTLFTFFCPPWPATPAYVGDSGGCVSATFDLTAYAGSRVWLAWNHGGDSFSSADQGWSIDDVRIEASMASGCSVPPQPVQFLTATATAGTNDVEWLNPSAGGYGSTVIRYSTSDFPVGPADGTLLVDQNDGAGAKGSATHGGLIDGTTYYYSAFVDNGSGAFSARKTVSARPFDTSGAVRWAYSTGASALAPPGIGSVYGVANDRAVHSMDTGGSGTWPTNWKPAAMNAPAQGRPPIVPIALGGATKVAFLGSQDGHVHAVNAQTGQPLPQWGPLPGPADDGASAYLGAMVQASPSGMFTAFGGAYDLILVGTRNGSGASAFHGIHLADGTLAWTFTNAAGAQGGDDLDIGIISGNAMVDYATQRVYFTSRRRAGGSSNTAWCLSFTDTSVTRVWARDVGDVDGGPVLWDGKLYIGNNDGEIHALDAGDGTSLWAAPYATGDGPIKGFIWPIFGTAELLFSTTNSVWTVLDNGASAALKWELATIPGPSQPLAAALAGVPYAWVGGSDGSLYQLDTSGAAPTTTSVVLGGGLAAVGGPALDVFDGIAYVGTENGRVYSVDLPLP